MNDFELKISFDSDKFSKLAEEIKEKYVCKPVNDENLNAIKQEIKQAAYNLIKVEW